MAVVLVLASGTAVSLAVTGDSATDAGPNAVAVQDTTTEADGVEETTTAVDGEDTTTVDDEQASVTFGDQESDGARVVIESVTMPEGGFIAIHDSSVEEAPIASVLGNSVYLPEGTYENVTVTLARPITESQTLVAMPHFDTNENRVYDFVLSTGELDGPYTADGSAVIDSANVTVQQETTTKKPPRPRRTSRRLRPPRKTSRKPPRPKRTSKKPPRPKRTSRKPRPPRSLRRWSS
jgi:hypothetical protein